MHHQVLEFVTLDSTNSEARRLAEKGERGALWVRADQQEEGRGRCGRTWLSPEGNLSATFLFMPECSPLKFHELTLVAGVAVCDAMRLFLADVKIEQACRLKWPNDLMIDKAKAGGILIETIMQGDSECLAFIGFGVNIAVKPVVEERHVTAMAEYGITTAPDIFLQQLDYYLCRYLELWDNGTGFDEIRNAWLQRSFSLGTLMSLNTSKGCIKGEFAGIAEDGALLLEKSAGQRLRYNFGDVEIMASAEPPDN